MTLLVGMLCPATGAVLITHGRLLQANLISHAVVPGIILALAVIDYVIVIAAVARWLNHQKLL